MHAAPALEAESLVKEFTTGRRGVRAVDDVSLTVDEGDFLAIMGPSGCGKSTLLHLLGGLATPTSGSVRVRGVDLSGLSDDARTDLRSTDVAFVFQRFNLVPVLTAEENVALPLVIAGGRVAEVRDRAQHALDLVGLADRADHRPAEMSGGEQQRVAIARAMVIEPSVVLADEPTGSLDSSTGGRVLELFSSLHEQHRLTVVLVTHDARVASAASELYTMRDGRIVDRQPIRRDGEAASNALAGLLGDDGTE